jgi:UDP-hydrolysing UDP-N-acetyl-D-glucosamine 2-epimerase
MKKKTICFVLVNRANYGRTKILLSNLKKNKNFKIKIILISSTLLKKYGNLNKVLAKDKLKADYECYTHIEGENLETMTKSTGLILLELSSIFNRIKPDIVFTVGDRFETLATSIAASYSNIFLTHLQGGELSGSIDEKVRHAVTKLSDLHLVSTKKSKQVVEQMGEDPKRVFFVGCPSIDIIKKVNFRKNINLQKYKYGIGHLVDLKKDYYVFLIHPVTTHYGENDLLVKELLKSAKILNEQIIWLWPNNDAGSNLISKKIRSFREKYNLKINFYTNFETEDYLRLIKNSKCLIGNSSSGIRESSFLKIPAVNIGDRQKNRERGNNVIDCTVDSSSIVEAIKRIINTKKFKQNNIYGVGNSSKKIIKILSNVELNNEKEFKFKK